MRINDIVKLNPFNGHRDVDCHRITTIARHYAKQYNAHGNVRIINPFVLVEGKCIGVELLDNTNNQVMKAICDGQHRIGALRVLLQRFPSLGNQELDVYVNEVQTMQEAYDIQRELFQQKPANLYDKKKTNNNVQSDLSDLKVQLEYHIKNAIENRRLRDSITEKRFSDAFKNIIPKKSKEQYHHMKHNTFETALTSNEKRMLHARRMLQSI